MAAMNSNTQHYYSWYLLGNSITVGAGGVVLDMSPVVCPRTLVGWRKAQ